MFNGSKSDPAAWVGKIKKVNKKTTTVRLAAQNISLLYLLRPLLELHLQR